MIKKQYYVKLIYINEKLSKAPIVIQGLLNKVHHKSKKSIKVYRKVSHENIIQTFNLKNTKKVKNVYLYKQ